MGRSDSDQMIALRRFTLAIAAGLLCIIHMVPGATVRVSSQQVSTRTYDDREQGISLYKSGNIEGALKAFRAGVGKFKDDALTWHYLGLTLILKNDLKGARRAFQKAVSLRPDFAPSRAAWANTLLFTKSVREAEPQAKLALSLDAQNAEAHYVLGTIRLLQGSCADALAHADAALIAHADFSPSYLLRSQSLICDVARTSLKPWVFDGATYRTSAESADIPQDEKLLNMRRNALRFKEAAANLEKFLQLAPDARDAPLWREQAETLRLYSEPVDKTDADRTVFSPTEVTTKVRVLSKPEPTYTETARDARIEGTVVLRAVFAADGKVKNILVLSRLPNGLTERSISAARKIKFEPGTKEGQPVSMFMQLEYNFNLY